MHITKKELFMNGTSGSKPGKESKVPKEARVAEERN